MQEPEQGLEDLHQGAPGGRAHRLRHVRPRQHRLGQLEVPVAELVPREVVEARRDVVEAVALEAVAHLPGEGDEPGPDPPVRHGGHRARPVAPDIGDIVPVGDRGHPRGGDRPARLAPVPGAGSGAPGRLFRPPRSSRSRRLHGLDGLAGAAQHVPGRVPELVAEVPVPFDAAEVEADVAPMGRERAEREAQRIRPVGRDPVRKLPAGGLGDVRGVPGPHEPGGPLDHQRLEVDAVDEVQGVEDVPLRLRHLLPVRVEHEAVDVDVVERHVVHELDAHHDHPGDPEEDDVEPGDEDPGRVVPGEPLRLARPSQGRERPQGRREPGVEHVRVALQGNVRAEAVALPGLRLAPSHVDAAVRGVPGRDAMAPPDLAADAPVLDVVHPLEVDPGPVLGHETHRPGLDGADGGLGERGGPHEPLRGEARLHHRAGPLAARDLVAVRLHPVEPPRFPKVRHDPFAGGETVEAPVGRRRVLVEGGGVGEDVDRGQPVALPDRVVVEVVGGGDLEAAGAELRNHGLVRDDRDPAVAERKLDLAPDQVRIARVVRVHGDRHVPQHGLGAGGRDGDEARSSGRRVAERVAEVPQVAILLLGLHLEVRDRGAQHRVPVHEPPPAVDEPLVVEPHEGLQHRFGEPFVQGEPLRGPVDGGAEPAELVPDGPARAPGPVPHPFDERLAAETAPVAALRLDLALDHHLGRDPGVVRPHLPQGVVAPHAVIADEGVHDRVLERMPHVEGSGHVRRRDHDAVRLAVAARREPAALFPGGVHAALDAAGIVGRFHVSGA